jgi:YVTN family beta-propeller protein
MDFLRRAVVATIACSWLFLSGCGGTYRPIASIVPVAAGNPQLADEVAVFNVNPNTSNVSGATGALSVFNVAGDSNVGNYSIGANDKLAAAAPPVDPLDSRLITFAGSNSFVASADTESDTVTLINTLQGATTVVTLPQGFVPTFITATATTGQILVSLQATTTAPNGTCAGKGAIGIVDTSTATLTGTVCACSNPGFIQVALSDTVAFILDQTDNSVRVLNIAAATLSTTPLAVGKTPIWATTSLDGNTLYVLNQKSNDISVIDAVGESVTTLSITTGTLSTPSVIITDRNLNRLYISNKGNGTVSVLDASSSTLPALKIVPVGTAPVALAVTPDGASVYVANTGASTVSVINANSFNVTALKPTTDVTARVQAVAVSKDGTKAFIAVTTSNDLANGIYVVLTSTNAFVTNTSGGVLNIAPPQDSSCDATESCSGVPLQRPVQIVPRI